jgi:hypothetical protein
MATKTPTAVATEKYNGKQKPIVVISLRFPKK